MRAIIVEDEWLMIHKFARLTAEIPDLKLCGKFDDAQDALAFVKNDAVEVVFLDVEMPGETGISLAKKMKEINKSILIVFITAYDEYIRQSNEIGADYYIVKPYTKEVLVKMMEKLRLLSARQKKELYLQMFGRFLVKKNDIPLPIRGKAKEILAFIATKRGREASNYEIYTTVWEGRPLGSPHMAVYYNALRRLKNVLYKEKVENLLIQTSTGYLINTSLVDCDYYSWQDGNGASGESFNGEFLSEYSWGEYILGNIIQEEWKE